MGSGKGMHSPCGGTRRPYSAGLGIARRPPAPTTVAAGDEPPMNSQIPSSPSSSLCPEKNAQKKASEAESEWLRWSYSTTRKPWYQQQSTSMSSYPVHRSLPPTRRSSSDGNLVPGEA
jgi:hypothetical protein